MTPAASSLPATLPALRSELHLFREAIFAVRARLNPGLAYFPAGACADASLLLARHLQRRGLPATTLAVQGYQDGQFFSHVWVQVGAYHLDITADQFGEPWVFLARHAPRVADRFEAYPYGTLEAFDADTRGVLERDEAEVLGALARRRSDRRQWPRQAVVDRWQGMDVLACGHLRTAERQYSLPRARRCPDCPSATPAGQFRVLAEDRVLDAFAALSDEERGAVLTAWFQAQGHRRDSDLPPAAQDGH